MGVSKNRGTPKWMVYGGNPIKMDDLGVPLTLNGSKWCLRLGDPLKNDNPLEGCTKNHIRQEAAGNFWHLEEVDGGHSRGYTFHETFLELCGRMVV